VAGSVVACGGLVLNQDRGVTVAFTVGAGVVVGALAWVGLTLWVNGGHDLPQPSWIGIVVMVLMAMAVLAAAWDIRRYLRGGSRRMPSPQRGRRTLVAAQACALGGAVIAGWYAAQAVVLVPDTDVPSVRGHLWFTLGLVGAAVVLAAAGLRAQGWCRIPDPRRHDDEDDD
jgi:hypothetical protein